MSKQMKGNIPKNTKKLYLDVGNSSVKAAFKGGVGWTLIGTYDEHSVDNLLEFIREREKSFSMIFISSVVEATTVRITRSLDPGRCRVFEVRDIPGDLLEYESPETLGLDRFFACYGAVSHTNRAAVVVDAGTACTMDYMTGGYVYRGGVIMPGIAILEQALIRHTPALPLVDRRLPEQWPGKNTRTSLQWGLTGFFKDALEAMVKRYETSFGAFDLVLTGGGAEWVSTLLSCEVKVRPYLVFEGMERFTEDYL